MEKMYSKNSDKNVCINFSPVKISIKNKTGNCCAKTDGKTHTINNTLTGDNSSMSSPANLHLRKS